MTTATDLPELCKNCGIEPAAAAKLGLPSDDFCSQYCWSESLSKAAGTNARSEEIRQLRKRTETDDSTVTGPPQGE